MIQTPAMEFVNILLTAEQGPSTRALVKVFLLLLPHCCPRSSAAAAENHRRALPWRWGTADPAAQAEQSRQQREPSSALKSYGIVPFCFSIQYKLNATLTGFSTAPS